MPETRTKLDPSNAVANPSRLPLLAVNDPMRSASFESNWKPLSLIIGDSTFPPFMFMAAYKTDCGTEIFTYKHKYTRRYLNIDHKRRCYKYIGDGFQEISREDAMSHAYS